MKRFWEKVDKSGDCWEWLDYKQDAGYGRFWFEGKNHLAHRMAYQLTVGEIPKGDGYHGTCVLHRCDNPSCVNPNHLFLGTQADNLRDAANKRRCIVPSSVGTANNHAKLTEYKVLKIRKSSGTLKEIAAKFGVSLSLISLIKNNKLWNHI